MKGAEVYESPSATYALGAAPVARDDTTAVAAHATAMKAAATRERMALSPRTSGLRRILTEPG